MEKFTSNNFAFSDDVSLRSITISDLTRSIKFGLKVKDEDILNYACLASHVYGDKKDSLLQNGWHKSNETYGIVCDDKETGMFLTLYERTKNNEKEYVCAFRGTKNALDWKNNIQQLLGFSPQYKRAKESAKLLVKYIEKDKLTFVGHSQGGGEAALAAYETGCKAVTFNPAGLSLLTKIINKKSPFGCSVNICSFIMISDVLNIVQQIAATVPLLQIAADGDITYMFPKKTKGAWHLMDSFLLKFGIDPEKYKSNGHQ
jgi:hypothetical protein